MGRVIEFPKLAKPGEEDFLPITLQDQFPSLALTIQVAVEMLKASGWSHDPNDEHPERIYMQRPTPDGSTERTCICWLCMVK